MRTPAARATGNSRTMFGNATRRASSASSAKPSVRTDHRALTFLGDDRGVSGRREVGELGPHAGADFRRHVIELSAHFRSAIYPFASTLDSAGCSTYFW